MIIGMKRLPLTEADWNGALPARAYFPTLANYKHMVLGLYRDATVTEEDGAEFRAAVHAALRATAAEVRIFVMTEDWCGESANVLPYLARLAEAVLAKLAVDGLPTLRLRGVRCMSQCKRACTVSLTAAEAFTWIFGDLDPERHADDVIALAHLYGQSPDGFMARDARPEPMRAGVLGRLPPIASEHEIIEPLAPLAK